MKPYLFIVLALTSAAAWGQQLPSQVQAKRGVFTERLFLTDRWINRISTNINSADSTSNNVLATAKAIADFMRLHIIQTASVTADEDYVHNWNHKQLYIDSIYRLRFDVTANSMYADDPKIYNSFRMYCGKMPDSAITLSSALRTNDNTSDSTISWLSIMPQQALLQTFDNQTYLLAGPEYGSIDFAAYNFASTDLASEVSIDPGAITLTNRRGNFFIYGLTATDDTAAYKPIGNDALNGKIVSFNNWQPAGTGSNKDTTYMPAYTGFDNVAGISGAITSAMRIGNTVHVSGLVTVDPISASGTNTFFQISLPWESDLLQDFDCTGTGFNFDYQMGGQIIGDGTNDKATFKFASLTTNPIDFSFSFQYRIRSEGR